ncbi:hypothetical protein FSP39_025218 [Pinctada imbricata]|uniref:Uncharacterized protein n=1 Tax=Pinctada imbricata TaxID=66713 RepID=A0AA88YGE5_PINIB|nr:hypothetical protein FSP39_025218 [Pinctada imbricata]
MSKSLGSVVQRGDVDVRALDSGVKNPWKWEWMERALDLKRFCDYSSNYINQELQKKKLTKEGRDRKQRIADKLFEERKPAKLVLGLHASVFPLLKSFVMLFETKEPLIHLLHEEQVDEAYTLCSKVLQEKLPLTNLLLRALGAFHPDARGHAVTLNYLQKLPTLA